MTVELARLHVDWTLDARPGAEPLHRLDALVRDLRDQALEDPLAAVDGPGLTCIRTVEVAPVTVRWTSSDRELLQAWASEIARAVADARAAGPVEAVVHYPNRTALLTEVVLALLTGDLTRSWAWELAGVGRGSGSPTAARGRGTTGGAGDRRTVPSPASPASPRPRTRQVVDAALALAEEAPQAVPALVVEAARRGLLGGLVAALGGHGLDDLLSRAGVAWRASPIADAEGGHHPAAGGAGAPVVGALARLVRSRSVILAAATAAGLLPARPPAGASPSGALTRHGAPERPVRQRPGRRPDDASGDRAGGVHPPGDDAMVATTLAALAVLEVEPAYADRGAGRAAAALLSRGDDSLTAATTLPPPPWTGHAAGTGVDRTAPSPSDRDTDDDARVENGDPEPPGAAEPGPRPTPAPTPVPRPVATTAWGGLLFLLRLVADADLPERVVAEPGRFGTGLRGVLHRLGSELVRRAAPDVGTPDPRDPALLAFCGLPSHADPPERPEAVDDGWIVDEAARLVGLLRERLDDPDARSRPEQRLLLGTLRRRARVRVEPGWMDIELDLDEVTTELRRAGLDLDPGHLPWLGLVVRFGYV